MKEKDPRSIRMSDSLVEMLSYVRENSILSFAFLPWDHGSWKNQGNVATSASGPTLTCWRRIGLEL